MNKSSATGDVGAQAADVGENLLDVGSKSRGLNELVASR